MASNLPSPSPSEERPPRPDGPPVERHHREHYGPLDVERLTKDDGRALLLFSERQHAPA